jgi:hypothetical protein
MFLNQWQNSTMLWRTNDLSQVWEACSWEAFRCVLIYHDVCFEIRVSMESCVQSDTYRQMSIQGVSIWTCPSPTLCHLFTLWSLYFSNRAAVSMSRASLDMHMWCHCREKRYSYHDDSKRQSLMITWWGSPNSEYFHIAAPHWCLSSTMSL